MDTESSGCDSCHLSGVRYSGAMHKWYEMRQEKAHEELTAQVVGMSEAGTTGETMPEKKVPEVENEIDETNAIKETEYVSAIDFALLDSQNPDVVAWIQIPGTQINYPVVQGKDNDYYLHRDLNGQKSTAGTIFLDENHPMTERTQNLLLHGHNMKDGTMFGRLAQYEKNLEYLKAHAFIDFSTLWHQERYVVFAVLDVSLDIGDDRFVEYFAHPTFKSDEEFERYIRRVELASLYAIPMDVKPTDALLTLSTCLDEDRLVILARRQRENRASLREIVNMAVRQ